MHDVIEPHPGATSSVRSSRTPRSATLGRWRRTLGAFAVSAVLASCALVLGVAPASAQTIGATIPVGGIPSVVAVSPDGTHAYVVDYADKEVVVVDTATNTVTGTISGLAGPFFGIAVSPDSTHVYITNLLPNTMSVIDAATNTVTANVAVGTSPAGVAVSPNGDLVYVANGGSNTVSVVDAATDTVTATIPVGTVPFGVAVTPDGSHLYVTDGGSNTVSVIDTATDTVTATIPVGNAPTGLAVSPDGTRVYVPNQGSDTVSVIDTATNTVTATVPVGDTPVVAAVSPDSHQVYVTNQGSNSVSIIDAGTDTVSSTVGVGSLPFGIAASPTGAHVYVVNSSDGTVSVIDVAEPPTITSAPGSTFTVGQAGSFTVTSVGSPTAALSVSGILPLGVSFTDNGDGTATLAGTPTPGGGGMYPLTITAANGTTPNPTQNFTLTIDEAPAVTSAAAATFNIGQAGSFTVDTTGYPRASVSVSGALPQGVTFTDYGNGTGAFTGTAASGSGGSYPLTITAANGVAPDASQSFTLTVPVEATSLQAQSLSIWDSLWNRGATFTATLTSQVTNGGVAGQTVTFSAGNRSLCSATTDATGRASCRVSLVRALPAFFARSFTATFVGNGKYLPASADGAVTFW